MGRTTKADPALIPDIEANLANNKPTYLNWSSLWCLMRFDLHVRHSHCVIHS